MQRLDIFSLTYEFSNEFPIITFKVKTLIFNTMLMVVPELYM